MDEESDAAIFDRLRTVNVGRGLQAVAECTFIILDKCVFLSTGSETDAMIGDTNLFFNDSQQPNIAEIEIMIADEASRGKKRGWESVLLMMRYGFEALNINKFRAKIKSDNVMSINMFEKLGFQEVERSEIFREITLEREASSDWMSWLHSELQSVTPNSH
ncbi:n-acetyltransferase 9-like protein [Lasius niger]|uniref:N-acetyltransferase 9-like protein n=1 Tax=Lasius niger TaxID=67767 RepID=A0A0J7KTP3_LASNI|nr:n-acetyltransferase 9-like protein [Lasius niger]